MAMQPDGLSIKTNGQKEETVLLHEHPSYGGARRRPLQASCQVNGIRLKAMRRYRSRRCCKRGFYNGHGVTELYPERVRKGSITVPPPCARWTWTCAQWRLDSLDQRSAETCFNKSTADRDLIGTYAERDGDVA